MKIPIIDFSWKGNRPDLINTIAFLAIVIAINHLGKGLTEDVVVGAIVGSFVHFVLQKALPK